MRSLLLHPWGMCIHIQSPEHGKWPLILIQFLQKSSHKCSKVEKSCCTERGIWVVFSFSWAALWLVESKERWEHGEKVQSERQELGHLLAAGELLCATGTRESLLGYCPELRAADKFATWKKNPKKQQLITGCKGKATLNLIQLCTEDAKWGLNLKLRWIFVKTILFSLFVNS